MRRGRGAIASGTASGRAQRRAFAAGTFASFADLMQHATQSGSSTLITDTHGDSLTLQHVAMAHLTSSDFILS